MINRPYLNSDEPQAQEPDSLDQDSQYAPTPGYCEQTLPFEYGFSPSSNLCPQDGPEPISSTQLITPKLLRLPEWEARRPDDKLPGNVIRYNIEWKVKVNNRFISEDTEKEVALAPSAYWPLILNTKLERVIKEKVSRRRKVRSDDTSIVVSVDDRRQRDLKKRFNCLRIDWTAVEKQLMAWGKLHVGGKELRLVIIFNYIDDRLPTSTTGRNERRGSSPVNKRTHNERDEKIDAEQHISGEPSIWRAVYNLMRCPSPSCHLGPYCWQDSYGKKHYQIRKHHLERLITYVEGGGILDCQDDIPDAIREELFSEEQQRLEISQSNTSKIQATGNYLSINMNFIGVQPYPHSSAANPNGVPALYPQHISDQLSIDGPRDMAVKEYSAWQETNVVDGNLKAQFQKACEVTLANGLDLEQIYEDQDPSFSMENGVTVGIARRFVSDIGRWVRHIRK